MLRFNRIVWFCSFCIQQLYFMHNRVQLLVSRKAETPGHNGAPTFRTHVKRPPALVAYPFILQLIINCLNFSRFPVVQSNYTQTKMALFCPCPTLFKTPPGLVQSAKYIAIFSFLNKITDPPCSPYRHTMSIYLLSSIPNVQNEALFCHSPCMKLKTNTAKAPASKILLHITHSLPQFLPLHATTISREQPLATRSSWLWVLPVGRYHSAKLHGLVSVVQLLSSLLCCCSHKPNSNHNPCAWCATKILCSVFHTFNIQS